jgi:hypothetical protein
MTKQRHNPGIEEKIRLTSDHAKATTCRRCGRPIITAVAGHIAGLTVRADPEPLSATEEILALLDGRLTWHLITEALGTQRITWRDPTAIRAGPKPGRHVIADHRCRPQPRQEPLL